MVRPFKAFILDVIFWSYSSIILYKIIFQKLILELRYPSFFWSEPLIASIIGTFLALLFFYLPDCSLGKRIMGLVKPQTRTNRPWLIGGYFFTLTMIASVYFTQISLVQFFSREGLAGAGRIFNALIDPNFAIFEDALLEAITTIFMAFMSTILALPVAFVLSFVASGYFTKNNSFLYACHFVIRFFLNLTRSIEPLVWAIIFSVWVGIGPFAGMLALAFHSIAALAKLYSEQIDNIDLGPVEATVSTGASTIQVVWYAIIPQIILPYLSFTIYRWDINVRMATIIGLVGGGGIGTMLMQYQGLARWHEVGLIILIIAIIVGIMDFLSAKLREIIL